MTEPPAPGAEPMDDLHARVDELERTVSLLLQHALRQHDAKGYCHDEGPIIPELRAIDRREAI